MKRNFSLPLNDIDGNPLVNNNLPFTLGSAAIGALLATFEDERHLPGEQKFQRYMLANKIHANPEALEVSAEEIAMLKNLIGKAYTPIVVGPAFLALESDTGNGEPPPN